MAESNRQRRAFTIENISSSDDSSDSSEDFHSSSDELIPPPQFDYAQHTHYNDDEGSDEIEEEFIDYEGRDSIQPIHELKTISLIRPFGRDISHMDKLQIFKNQIGLLEQSENRPQTIDLDMLGENDGSFDIEEDDNEYRNSFSPQDQGKDENLAEDGGAIEVDEPFIQQPITFPSPQALELAPLEESLFKNNEIQLEGFPPGHQYRRSFRVGWGPDGSLVIPRRVNFGKKGGQNIETETDESAITISKIQVFDNAHTTVHLHPLHEVNTKKQDFSNEIFLLEKHLHFSKKEKTQKPNDLTYFTVSNPDDLIKVNRKGSPSSNEKEEYQYDSELWYLVEMLWGTPTDIFANNPSSSYSNLLYRRNAVSRWFSDTTSAAVEVDLQNLKSNLTEEEKECATMFQYLTTKKISTAVDVALQSKDFRFAALVSQAASNNALFKKNIYSQVVQWKNTKAFDAVNPYRQHIYNLLSGDIDGGANLVDWKRGLALYFWYGRDVTMRHEKEDNLQLALKLFDEACRKSKAHLPYPKYLLKSVHKDQKSEEFDTRYHLLKLFCHPDNYPIRTVLQPNGYTEHLLDYHLSWQLHKVLRNVTNKEFMDVRGLEQWNLLDYEVSMNYVFQLETMGHWEWALYVLLNIYSPVGIPKESLAQLLPHNKSQIVPQHSHYNTKIDSIAIVENAFKEILSRHVPDFVEHPEKRNFLTEELQIPETWIKAAEATYQHYKKNYRAELELLLESEQWEAAHSVLMKNLLYQLLLHEKSQELIHILEKLTAKSKFLMEWPNRGGLFLNYLKLIDSCKTLIQTNSKQDNEKLVTQLNATLQRIQNWNSNNLFNSESQLLQQACIDEMSTIIHSQISIINKKESINRFNRGQIELQALPNDLVKHHLDTSTNHFLHNLTRI